MIIILLFFTQGHYLQKYSSLVQTEAYPLFRHDFLTHSYVFISHPPKYSVVTTNLTHKSHSFPKHHTFTLYIQSNLHVILYFPRHTYICQLILIGSQYLERCFTIAHTGFMELSNLPKCENCDSKLCNSQGQCPEIAMLPMTHIVACPEVWTASTVTWGSHIKQPRAHLTGMSSSANRAPFHTIPQTGSGPAS